MGCDHHDHEGVLMMFGNNAEPYYYTIMQAAVQAETPERESKVGLCIADKDGKQYSFLFKHFGVPYDLRIPFFPKEGLNSPTLTINQTKWDHYPDVNWEVRGYDGDIFFYAEELVETECKDFTPVYPGELEIELYPFDIHEIKSCLITAILIKARTEYSRSEIRLTIMDQERRQYDMAFIGFNKIKLPSFPRKGLHCDRFILENKKIDQWEDIHWAVKGEQIWFEAERMVEFRYI